ITSSRRPAVIQLVLLAAALYGTLITSANLSAQQEVPDTLEPQVTFLSQVPAIDGILDEELVRKLPLR
ncbi:MAG: hypothetical protein OER90_19295, partial [Gemmatimonadota bacterium]|nr:hypothetical protein [Gemmatimonadota bacterium]